MNDKAVEKAPNIDRDQLAVLEKVIAAGDLKGLSTPQRLDYYNRVCASVGLNPLTRPFEYLELNGKLTLYARKDATDQLRALHGVSVHITDRQPIEGCFVVTSVATLPSGRTDESIGAVPIPTQQGEARANAMMKAESKSKRRVTLSICGLGFLDETETDGIPGATRVTETQIAVSPTDDRAEQGRFWGTAKRLGYLDANGRINKDAVHDALGVPRGDGKLRTWINAGHTWQDAIAILESLPIQDDEPDDEPDVDDAIEELTRCADCGERADECDCFVGSAGPKEPEQPAMIPPARRDPIDARR